MSDHSLVTPIVRRKAEALGGLGEAWLASLPDLIADLERRWSVRVGQPLAGGTSAYVAQALTRDGVDVVLKLGLPDPQFADEVGTIARARGCGYVHLLAHDAGRHTMLLEALGPSMTTLGMAPEAQLETLCRLLRQAWDVPRAVTGRHASAVDKASGLNRFTRRFAQARIWPRWHFSRRPHRTSSRVRPASPDARRLPSQAAPRGNHVRSGSVSSALRCLTQGYARGRYAREPAGLDVYRHLGTDSSPHWAQRCREGDGSLGRVQAMRRGHSILGLRLKRQWQ